MSEELTIEELKKELEEWKEFGEMMANNYNTVSEWHSEAQDWLEKACALLKDTRDFIQDHYVCLSAYNGRHDRSTCPSCGKRDTLMKRMPPFFPEEAR